MNKPMNPTADEDRPEVEPTLDLDLGEFEGVEDLQALADEVAQSTPDAAPAAPPSHDEMEASLFKARARIAELEKQEVEQKDKHQRLLADFANHRNRVGRETQLAVTLAEKKLLLELLPVVDSFERCLAANYSNVEEFQNGIGLIHKQLLESLRKAGVTEVDVKVGDPFDAHLAEALTTTILPNLPDGAVATVYERGYTLRDMLLRPARVIVNHAPPAQEPLAAGDPSN
ncbi:MAG: nucleotide exchange factor GrpE [Holophaga sp.]|nr:nucleotide exchange factor GrpE [Holophaga sp.]